MKIKYEIHVLTWEFLGCIVELCLNTGPGDPQGCHTPLPTVSPRDENTFARILLMDFSSASNELIHDTGESVEERGGAVHKLNWNVAPMMDRVIDWQTSGTSNHLWCCCGTEQQHPVTGSPSAACKDVTTAFIKRAQSRLQHLWQLRKAWKNTCHHNGARLPYLKEPRSSPASSELPPSSGSPITPLMDSCPPCCLGRGTRASVRLCVYPALQRMTNQSGCSTK